MLINHTPKDNNNNKFTVFEGESILFSVTINCKDYIFINGTRMKYECGALVK